jgi:hypothetical protein
MLSVHCIPVALAAIDFHRIADGFRMPFQDNYYLWKAIGYGGILIFGSRFFVQWLYSEGEQGAADLLVAKPGRHGSLPGLRAAAKRFGLHGRLYLQSHPLHPKHYADSKEESEA